MKEADKNRDRWILPWELIVSFLSLSLTGLLLVQRELVFSKGKWGLFTEDSLPLAIWALVAGIILGLGQPQKRISKWGSHLRIFSLLCASLSLIFVLSCVYLPTRFQLLRMEVMNWNLGITNYEDGLNHELNTEILDPDIGPYILQDKELLKHLAVVSDEVLLKWPRAAPCVMAALLKQGVGFEQLFSEAENRKFLLAVLVSEANPQPWHKLEWVPQPAVAPSPQNRLYVGLLNQGQARQIYRSFLPELESLDRLTIECLVYCLMNFPGISKETETEAVLAQWAKSFEELESLAVESLIRRDRIEKFLESQGDEIQLHVVEKNLGIFEEFGRGAPVTIREAALGLIRASGKKMVLTDEPKDAVIMNLEIASMFHHDYQKPHLRLRDLLRESKQHVLCWKNNARQQSASEKTTTGSNGI